MLLTTTNGHNEAIVNKFNVFAQQFDDYGLLEIILNNFCDDQDIEEITGLLEERLDSRDKKRDIQSMLISKFKSIGMDIPNNMDEIVEFCYQDVCETADEINWHDGDVAIALRRWMEQQN